MTALDQMHTIADIADSWRVSRYTLRRNVARLVREGRLAVARGGEQGRGPYLFTDDDVKALKRALTPAAPEPVKRRRRRAA